MRWRFLDSGARDGAEQMALDAGLMDRARVTGEAVFRVYAWRRPTLSFGRHEGVRERFSPAVLASCDVDAVRRPTGGRVLLHHHEVTYSVTAPVEAGTPVRQSYRRINEMLSDALRRIGVDVREATAVASGGPGNGACFAAPSAGELVVDGRKLVGSAQVRERGALLQHGSILLEDDQARIAELAVGPMTPARPAATLRNCLGHAPTYAAVTEALAAALHAVAPGAAELPASDAEAYAAPHLARFASAEWTWRR